MSKVVWLRAQVLETTLVWPWAIYLILCASVSLSIKGVMMIVIEYPPGINTMDCLCLSYIPPPSLDPFSLVEVEKLKICISQIPLQLGVWMWFRPCYLDGFVWNLEGKYEAILASQVASFSLACKDPGDVRFYS